MSSKVGTYSKIDNLVYAFFETRSSGTFSNKDEYICISALPFISKNEGYTSVLFAGALDTPTSAYTMTDVFGCVIKGSSRVNLYTKVYTASVVSAGSLTGYSFRVGSTLNGCVIYQV